MPHRRKPQLWRTADVFQHQRTKGQLCTLPCLRVICALEVSSHPIQAYIRWSSDKLACLHYGISKVVIGENKTFLGVRLVLRKASDLIPDMCRVKNISSREVFRWWWLTMRNVESLWRDLSRRNQKTGTRSPHLVADQLWPMFIGTRTSAKSSEYTVKNRNICNMYEEVVLFEIISSIKYQLTDATLGSKTWDPRGLRMV